MGEINPSIILLGGKNSEIPYGDKKLLEYAIAVRSAEIKTESLSSQGHTDIVLMSEKITALKRISWLWRKHLENGNLELFPPLCKFVSENNVFSVKNSDMYTFLNWEVGFF